LILQRDLHEHLCRSILEIEEIIMQKISEVMNTDVQTISPDATIEEAAQQMRDGDFGVLPVGETENLMGIITDRDIVVRAVAEGMGVNTKVKDAMSEEVICVNEDDSIEDAAQLMSDYQIRRLPVVDTDGRLVGIVSLGDFAVESSEIEPVMEALSDISSPR
jgi:CBS domain-containing protein